MTKPKKQQKTANWKDVRALATELVVMKTRLASNGLWKSVHALDEALKVFGWEAAEKLPSTVEDLRRQR